jgi:hypothetical protein
MFEQNIIHLRIFNPDLAGRHVADGVGYDGATGGKGGISVGADGGAGTPG